MTIGRLGNYEVFERIGEGGMGVVFRARDVRLSRIVALKVLAEEFQQDRAQRRRLLHEARTLAELNHPHIAICFECDVARLEPPDLLSPGAPGPHLEPVFYLAMEYVPGHDLAAATRGKSPALEEVLDLALQIASGLEAAHRAGVVHRDLKPTNIRVTPEGQVKILDFGLARSRPADRGSMSSSWESSSYGTVVGTVGYMSPEQAQGQHVDARSDLFSLGVILYELVTGRIPFQGRDTLEVLYAIANQEPQPLTRLAGDAPRELERVVHKLLAKRPADRYASAHELEADLARLREELPRRSRTTRRWVPVPRARSVAIALAAVVAVGAGYLGWRGVQQSWSGSQRVAVTDFRNLTGDQSYEYLAVGFSADLLNELVQHTDLVTARGVIRDAQGRPEEDPRRIARELGVGRVVTGGIVPTAAGLRLQIEVVDGKRGFVRWAHGFDFTPGDLPRVRQSVLDLVAAQLVTRWVRDPHADEEAAGLSSEAFEAYLRGLEQLADSDDPLARDRALARFQNAVELDSTFALAWAGRSRALWWVYDRDHDPELLRGAIDAAERAVRLGPDLIQAHLARARIYRETGNTKAAIAELRQVLAVNPSYDDAYVELGNAYRKIGDLAGAEASYRRAVELRPGWWKNWNAWAGYWAGVGSYPQAAEAYRQVTRLVPDMNRGYEGLGVVCLLEGRYADAIATFRSLPKPVTDATLASNIASAYFFAGETPQALRYYLMAVSLEPNDAVLRQNLGDCYSRMRRSADALEQYLHAAQFTRAALELDQDNPRLRIQLIVNLAKSGECDSAAVQTLALGGRLPDRDVEILHELAKAHAVCGRAPEALAALRRIVRLGSPPNLFRSEDEFISLRSDPAFQRLVRGDAR